MEPEIIEEEVDNPPEFLLLEDMSSLDPLRKVYGPEAIICLDPDTWWEELWGEDIPDEAY